jgi:hypothetical protein
MKWKLFMVSMMAGSLAFAQTEEVKVIRSTTELFATPKCDENPIGIFARGSKVIVLKTEGNSVLVETNAKYQGYIKKGYLVKHLNANDKYEDDPTIFIGGIDGRYFENRGLYTNVAGLRARAEPSISGLVIKQLNMNHRCDVDFIPYDPNGWVCGGTIWDGEGDFQFFVPVKYVGKQTDIKETMAIYRFKKGKSLQEDKQLAERIFEMSYWESDSIRLEALLLFRDLITTYKLSNATEDIDFEIFVLQNSCLDYKLLDYNLTWSYWYNGKEMTYYNRQDVENSKMSFTYVDGYLDDLGECGWDCQGAYFLPGIVLIDEPYESSTSEKYPFSVWKIDFSNPAITIKFQAFEITHQTQEKDFVLGLGKKILHSELKDGKHIYYMPDGDAGFAQVEFLDGKLVRWELEYFC